MHLAPSQAQGLLTDLTKRVGVAASNSTADRVAYSRDLWPRQQIRVRSGDVAVAPPAVIAWPANEDEVSSIINYAAERGIPVVPYGAGSGVCGGVLASPETIVMDMKGMRAIRNVDSDNLTCTAQGGVIGQHLEEALNIQGFTLGHFPSSIYCSSLGGWLAGRSAGQCSGRYGKIEDMVHSLACVDGRGDVLVCDHEQQNRGLLPLVVGSEGILAAITEATMRIAPAPTERQFASWLMPSTEAGLSAIRQIYQAGFRPAVARLYDPFDSMVSRTFGKRGKRERDPVAAPPSGPGRGVRALKTILRRPGILNQLIHAVPDRAMGGAKLVLVWEDDPAIGEAECAAAARICRALHGKDTGEDPARHWLKHRHSVSYRQSPMFAAGAFVDTMEVAATWSRLLPMYNAVRAALAKRVFVMAHFSHAYPDGASIYFTFAGSAADDQSSLVLYDLLWSDALNAVIEAGGTLSHHHGVGRSKAPKMRTEQGAAIDVVRALKRTMDPHNILNPGALIGEA